MMTNSTTMQDLKNAICLRDGKIDDLEFELVKVKKEAMGIIKDKHNEVALMEKELEKVRKEMETLRNLWHTTIQERNGWMKRAENAEAERERFIKEWIDNK